MAANLGDGPQACRAEVDRCLAAPGSRRPGRVEKLRTRPHQISGSGPDPFRVAEEHVGAGRQLVEQQCHVPDQSRRERLHPFDRDTCCDLVQHLRQ